MGQDDEMLKNKVKNQTTSKVAEKTATAVGGPIAGAAVKGLNKTKTGQAVLSKGAEKIGKNPMTAKQMNSRNQMGASNAPSSGSETSNPNGAPTTSGSAPSTSSDVPNSSMNLGDRLKGAGASALANSVNSESKTGQALNTANDVKATIENVKKIKKIAIISGPFIGYFLIILICIAGIIGFILGPADTVIQFFRDGWENLKTLVGYKDDEKWELEYYQKLDEVQEEINQKYGVCVDINLITATLTVDTGTDEFVETGNEYADANEAELESSKKNYKRMIKQIELLSNMQIRRTIYGFDNRVRDENEGHDDDIIKQLSAHYNKPIDELIAEKGNYCHIESEEKPVGDNENTYFDITPVANSFAFGSVFLNILQKGAGYFEGIPIRESSNSRFVAANDLAAGLFTFLSKKANEERNIEYKFYIPAYEIREYTKSDKTIGYKAYCVTNLPEGENAKNDFAKFDVGSLNDMENNVYYWNLIDQFIDKYYDKYLDLWVERDMISVEEPRYEKIKNIVEDIYLLYNEMGPSRECKEFSGNFMDCSSIDVTTTTLTKEEFVAGIMNQNRKNPEWQLIVDNAEQIYDVATANGVNPEIVVDRAIQEGFAPRSNGSGNYNIWGWNATNGEEGNATVWDTWDEALESFITGFKKSFPTNESYRNYAYLGDYWYNPGNSGLGGCYYKDYIFPNGIPDHVQEACNPKNSGTCTKNDTSQCVATTEEDQEAYRDYQVKTTSDIGSGIWGLSSNVCGNYGINEGSCIVFNQGDSRWANTPLLTGSTTIGKSGCFLTSIAIAATCSGRVNNIGTFNPLVLNNGFKQIYLENGINNQAEIESWNLLNQVLNYYAPGFQRAGSFYLSGDRENRINQLNSYLNGNRILILFTSHIETGYSSRGSHFEVLSAVEDNKLRMLNPSGGIISYWDPIYAERATYFEW